MFVNMIRSVLLLSILTGVLLGVGWLVGGFIGLTFALIISLVINVLSYWYSDKLVLKMYRAKELKSDKLDKMMKKLSQEAQIPQPKLYIVDKDVPNAFATGRDYNHSAVAVTKGLLQLVDEELEGVLAHEMAHIKNRDILISTMAAVIAGAISYIAQIGYFSLFFGGDRKGEGNLIGLVFIVIFAPIAALIIRSAISRTREYHADFTGALMTKNPHGLANALKKINQIAKNYPMRGAAATGHLWIVNPFSSDWFISMFSTHPSIEKRIARLEKMESRLAKEEYGG